VVKIFCCYKKLLLEIIITNLSRYYGIKKIMKFNLKNVFLSVGILAFTLALVGAFSTNKAYADTCTAIASGDWTNTLTWNAGCQTDTFPIAGDAVIIPSGFVVNVNAGAAAASVTIDNAGAPTGLTFAGGVTLSIAGAVTLNAPSAGTGTTTVAIGAGTLATDSLVITGGTGARISEVTLAPSGSLTVATDVTLDGTAANARLTTTGDGAKTIAITGNLIDGGTITFGGNTLTSTVTGTTLISSGGTLTASDATGTYTYTLLVTVNAGGVYNETVPGTHVTFSADPAIANAGTMTLNTGLHTISGVISNTGTFNYAEGVTLTKLAASTSGTVNYNGGAQTVQVIGYYNLTLSGTGVKVVGALTGATAILHALAINSTAQASLTGNSTADSLTFDSSTKAHGSWGSTSSTADHQNNIYFAGVNLVNVATGPSSTSTSTTTTTTTTTTNADTTAPTGTSVSINAGALTTSSLSSTLTLTAVDATQMIISNDAGFAGAAWETFATSKTWTLTSGDGVKTVYAKFRDAALNMSTAVSDIITVSGSGTVVVVLPPPTQGCSGGNLYNTSTGALCINNVEIPGCGNKTTGFSSASGVSCVNNRVTSATTTYNFGTTTLKNGSKGAAVMELQRFLNAKLNLGLVVDGKLGPKTIAVIKKWQKDHGLVADGLVGAKTKAKMHLEE